MSGGPSSSFISLPALNRFLQLYAAQAFPDEPLLEHVQELIATLEGLGVQPSPADEEEGGETWEDLDDDDDDDDDDVDMS